MSRPDVWMISISDNPVSQHYRDICKPTWEEQGFNVIDFEAVTPETVEKEGMDELEFFKIIRKDGSTRDFTETEKAIWWSHFVLWHKCLIRKKPIIVAEHDAFVRKELPSVLYRPSKLKFAFLGTAKGRNLEGKYVLAPCTAYYLTPEIASELVKVRFKRWSSKVVGLDPVGIYMNVDGYMLSEYWRINKEGKKRVKNYKQCVKQIVDDDIGTTIEHGDK